MTESSPLGVYLLYTHKWLGTTGWAPQILLPGGRIRLSQFSLSKTRVSCIAIATPTVNTVSIAIQISPDKQLLENRRIHPDRYYRESHAKRAAKHTATVPRDVRVATCTAPRTGDNHILHVYNGPQ